MSEFEFNNDVKYYYDCNHLLIKEDNTIIQNFPDYFIDHANKLKNNIKNNYYIFEVFNDSVLFIFYNWSWNYHINFIETAPILLYYSEIKKLYNLDNIYIACPESYKEIYIFLFKILNLDICFLIFFNKNIIFKNLYISNFNKQYFNGCLELSKKHYELFNTIKQYFTKKYINSITSINDNKKIYINRENNLAGANRFIYNNNDLLTYINNNKFEIVTFEKMTLDEKFLSTINSKIVISPIGANLVNFFFSNNSDINLFILLTPKVSENYINFNLLQLIELGQISKNKIKLLECEVIYNNLCEDPVNNPYKVDIDKLNDIINNFNNI